MASSHRNFRVRKYSQPMMRGVGILAFVVICLVLCTGASARSARRTCPTGLRHVLAANAQAEIFPEPGEEGALVFGCAYARSREYSLGYRPSCGPPVCAGVRHELLAGTVAVYEDYFTGMEEGEWYIVARDLRNDRVIRRIPTGAPVKPRPRNVGVGPVTGLVAKNNGSVAWIVRDYDRSTFSTPSEPEEVLYYDVYASDKTGTRLLAQGFNVSPSSLALAGSTMYWTQGGQPASATLK